MATFQKGSKSTAYRPPAGTCGGFPETSPVSKPPFVTQMTSANRDSPVRKGSSRDKYRARMGLISSEESRFVNLAGSLYLCLCARKAEDLAGRTIFGRSH